MKKILWNLIILFVPFMVMGKEYQINEVNYKISFDDDWIVITTNNLKDNSDLASLNITEEYMDNLWRPGTSYKIQQSEFAKQRDRHAALASRISEDDEAMEVHDVANPRGHRSRSGIGEFDM